jgi:hypothetical protein
VENIVMTEHEIGGQGTRRQFLRVGALTTLAVGTGALRAAKAHVLPPEQAHPAAYEKALAMEGGTKAVFQSPFVEASVVRGKARIHLLFAQLNNWLNAFQFSYGVPPADLHTVAALYASANTLTYNDTMWQKYRFGEKYNVIDPVTGQPATRNLFWPSLFGPEASQDPNAPKSAYKDPGIAAVQKRGTFVLT